MRLEGKFYDFGEGTIGGHLRAIALEIDEQAFINGEDAPDSRELQPLRDLSFLLQRIADELDGRQGGRPSAGGWVRSPDRA